MNRTSAPPQKKAGAKHTARRPVLQKALSEPGRPLPDGLRVELEVHFSTKLGGVRVQSLQEVNAVLVLDSPSSQTKLLIYCDIEGQPLALPSLRLAYLLDH